MLAPRRRRGTALADARLGGRLPGPAASVALVGDWHDRQRPGVVRRISAAAPGRARSRTHQTRAGWTRRTGAAADVPGVEHCRSIAAWWGARRDRTPAPEPAARSRGRECRPMTGRPPPRTSRPAGGSGAAIWLPGLAVALGAAVATAHGLFEVAVAARVPVGIAWLYPLITDGLALVAYAATARLHGSAARYAWAVVVLAAGLSGLAQAAYLAGGATLDASPGLRFGVGAWPAVAAAVVAHLLYLLATTSTDAPARVSGDGRPFDARRVQPSSRPIGRHARGRVEPAPHRPARAPRPTPALAGPPDASGRPSRRPRDRARAGGRSGTPPATAPCPPSPRSRPPPRSPAAPPPPSSSRSAADPCRCT